MNIIEGPNQEDVIQFTLGPNRSSVTLGRKNNVDMPFPDDHHLSNQHAKFVFIDNQVFLEDHSSTNG